MGLRPQRPRIRRRPNSYGARERPKEETVGHKMARQGKNNPGRSHKRAAPGARRARSKEIGARAGAKRGQEPEAPGATAAKNHDIFDFQFSVLSSLLFEQH